VPKGRKHSRETINKMRLAQRRRFAAEASNIVPVTHEAPRKATYSDEYARARIELVLHVARLAQQVI
jgi:hypothetical protein